MDAVRTPLASISVAVVVLIVESFGVGAYLTRGEPLQFAVDIVGDRASLQTLIIELNRRDDEIKRCSYGALADL
jgi:hypothetical protein